MPPVVRKPVPSLSAGYIIYIIHIDIVPDKIQQTVDNTSVDRITCVCLFTFARTLQDTSVCPPDTIYIFEDSIAFLSEPYKKCVFYIVGSDGARHTRTVHSRTHSERIGFKSHFISFSFGIFMFLPSYPAVFPFLLTS